MVARPQCAGVEPHRRPKMELLACVTLPVFALTAGAPGLQIPAHSELADSFGRAGRSLPYRDDRYCSLSRVFAGLCGRARGRAPAFLLPHSRGGGCQVHGGGWRLGGAGEAPLGRSWPWSGSGRSPLWRGVGVRRSSEPPLPVLPPWWAGLLAALRPGPPGWGKQRSGGSPMA